MNQRTDFRILKRTKNSIPAPGESFADKHPEQACKWDYYLNNSNGLLQPIDYMPASNQKAWFACGELGHPPFIASIKDMSNDKNGYCRMCRNHLTIGKNDMQTLHPELLIEWDYRKNMQDGFGYPFQYLPTSNARIHWKCSHCGHEWVAPIKSHVKSGLYCRSCSVKVRILNERIRKSSDDSFISIVDAHPDIVKYWDYDRNNKDGLLNPEYYSEFSGISAWFHCDNPMHKPWKTLLSNISRGSWCPQCSHNAPSYDYNFAYCHPEYEIYWNYMMNDWMGLKSPENYLPSSKKYAYWRCPYGHLMYRRIDLVSNNGLQCEHCKQEWMKNNSLFAKYPELCNEWNNEKNDDLKPEDFTEGSNKKVWWHCDNPNHDSFKQSIVSRTHDGSRCPQCMHKKPSPDYNLAVICPEILDEWDYKKNDKPPESYTPHSNHKVHWICHEGHEFIASIKERTGHDRTGCPQCSHLVSNEENELADAIISMFPDLKDEINANRNRKLIRFHDENGKVIGKKKEIDILIPSIHAGIEFNLSR